MSNPSAGKSLKAGDDKVDPSIVNGDTPAERLANVCHELGEHKGVNISIEVSDTFVFADPKKMTCAVEGQLGPDAGVYIYSRSFNATVEDLGRYMAALEATESANCTSSGYIT